MYIYTSWVVLSVWYYIIDKIICAQCGGENFTIGPLPTRNRLREKLSLSDQQGTFTTVVVLALKPLWVTAIRNSNCDVPQLVLALA